MLSLITLTSLWAAATAAAIIPEVQKRQANSVVANNVFLRRGYQSTAVLDGWAYIDGGEFSITSNNDIDYNYSNQLIAIDLSQDWTNSTVVLNTIAKPNAPDLTDGGIWVDQDNHQLYIGFAGRRSFMGNNQPQQLGLWSFKPDGQGSGTWNNLSTTADPNFNNLQRQFSSQVTSGNGVGYSLGGFYINTSNPDPSAHQITASGLMMYDYSSKKRTNFTVTGTQLSTTGGGQLGGMVFTPNFGSKGILLAAGGAQFNATTGQDNLVDFSTVSVFDVASQKWYDQPTTGNIPEKRKEFCMTGLASTNNTYEILVYAGWGGNLGSIAVPFDEAYVLTLPGFQWFKASYPASSPRHGLSCNPVGGGQIMTIGGVDSSQNKQYLYLGTFDSKDPFTQGLNIFDMNNLKFTNSYSAKPPAYTQAKVVANYYASNSRTPTFATTGLSSVFAVQNFAATSTPTSGGGSSTSNAVTNGGSNAGAIAGGVVGGVLGLALIIGAIWFFLRRRKTKQQRVNEMAANPAAGGYSDTPGTAGSAAVAGAAPAGYHEADGAAARHELGGATGAAGAGVVGGGEGAKYYTQDGKLGQSRASELPTDHYGDGTRYELQ